MTEEGRACPEHGLTECPGYKMIETSVQDKLYQRHQELRKKSGLPNPNYYKELKATFDLPDEERQVAVAAIKKKYKVNEAGPFSYGVKKPRRGSVADLAAKKRKEQEKDKQPVEPRDHMVGVARVVKDVAEGYWQDALKKSEADRAARKGKPFKKNPESHDKDGVYKGDKDLAGNPVPKRKEQGVAEGSGITKLNDYDTWLDRVDALGAEKHLQKNRTLIVAQSWDGNKVGEFDIKRNQGWVMSHSEQNLAEDAASKIVSKMIPGGASIFNAADAVRRFRSGDTVGAGIAAAGTIPITSIPAAAVDMARDKYYTGSFLPSDEQRDLANLNRQVADMEKKNWTKLPDGSERSPDGHTIRGTVAKLSAEPQSKPVPSSMKPDSSELPSKSYPDDAQSVKEQQAPDPISRYDQFMKEPSTSDKPGTKYYVGGTEVTGQEFDTVKQQHMANRSQAELDLDDFAQQARQRLKPKVKESFCVTNEDYERYIEELQRAGYETITEKRMTCPECGGAAYSDQMLAEKQDACYHKVKSRYKVWPSAYASGALVRCRKKGAKNWGNKSKK